MHLVFSSLHGITYILVSFTLRDEEKQNTDITMAIKKIVVVTGKFLVLRRQTALQGKARIRIDRDLFLLWCNNVSGGHKVTAEMFPITKWSNMLWGNFRLLLI